MFVVWSNFKSEVDLAGFDEKDYSILCLIKCTGVCTRPNSDRIAHLLGNLRAVY